MRKNKRKIKKQKKIIIFSTFGIFLLLTVGYAAFQTNLSIIAKVNIKENPYVEIGTIKVPIVNSEDGIYKDNFENNRYIYRGQNPNNYIIFNDEIWRIIAKETDGTLKIIRKEGLGMQKWDNQNNRQNTNNTYCNVLSKYDGITKYYGCNAWNAVRGNYTNGKNSGTVTQDATLNTYLNNEYYESINADKKYIVSHDFYTGSLNWVEATLQEIYEQEKERIWNGKIGLINVSDFLKSSINENCNKMESSRDPNTPCSLEKGNYLDENKQETWTINSYGDAHAYFSTSGIKTIGAYFNDIKGGVSGFNSIAEYLVRPVTYLKANIILSGQGTPSNPYTIIN